MWHRYEPIELSSHSCVPDAFILSTASTSSGLSTGIGCRSGVAARVGGSRGSWAQPIDDPIATLYVINDSDDVSREEVSAALGLSPAAAQSRIEIARALQTRLGGAAGALGEGTIGFLHVRTLVRETAALTDEQARAVDERVTGGQGCRSLSGWSGGVRRAVRRVAPAEFEVAAAAVHARRHLRWWPEADGMATISAFLPAHDAQTVWLALDALAQRGRDRSNEASESPRPRSPAPTLDSLRADALVAMARGVLGDPDLPRPHGRPVERRVTVSLDQLLQLREHLDDALDDTTASVMVNTATLEGYGPIPATALGDLDHVVPFNPDRDDGGGHTSAANLIALCRRHHRLKTHGGWQVVAHTSGATRWTSPGAMSYLLPAMDGRSN